MLKKIGKSISVALACAMLVAGCANNGASIMKIGDNTITEGQVQFFANYAIGTTDASVATENLKKSMIIKELADKMDVSLTDDETKQIKSSISSFKSNMGGKKAGDKLLKSYGVSDEFLMTVLASSTYSSQVLDKLDVAEPTDDEIKEYFKNSYLRAKHILISTKDMTTGEEFDEDKLAEAEKKANEVLEKAKNGEDFDALIKEYNEDPGMETNTDGYFFTDGDMVSEFENTTKSLDINGIDICKSDYGYHIILRLPIDETDAKFAEYLEDNKSSVKSALSSEKETEALDKKAEEEGIKIELDEKKINTLKIEEPKENK